MLRGLTFSLLLLGLLSPPARAATLDAERPSMYFAVVVGSNLPHRSGVTPLRYAFADAARMYRLFRGLPGRTALFGAPGPEVAAAEDADAQAAMAPIDIDAIDRAVRGWNAEIAGAKAAGWRTHLVFYYSGHGDTRQISAPGGEVYSSYLPIGGEAVGNDRLLELLSRSRAEYKHLILDACHAKGVARGSEQDIVVRDFTSSIASRPEIGVIAAASKEGEAPEVLRLQGGLLTSIVHSALVGAADADEDRLVSYAELFRFAKSAGLVRGSSPYGVQLEVEPPYAQFDRPLIDLRRVAAAPSDPHTRLELPARQAGRYRIELEGRHYAQWHAEAGQRVRVVVPRRAGVELLRCTRCETRASDGLLSLLLPRTLLARAELLFLEQPRWEPWTPRGVSQPGWRLHVSTFGASAAAVLELPSARTRHAKPRPPTGQRSVVFEALQSPEGDAELAAWAALADDANRAVLRQAMPRPSWQLCQAEDCAQDATITLALRGRVDRLAEDRIVWTAGFDSPAQGALEHRRGEVPAQAGALVDALQSGVARMVGELSLRGDLPGLQPVPAEVAPPRSLGAPRTLILETGGAPLQHWARWTGLTAMILAAAAGGLAAWTRDEQLAAERTLQDNPRDQAARRRFDRMESASFGLLGVAIGAGVAGLGLQLWDLVDETPSELPLDVVVGPQSGGLVVHY